MLHILKRALPFALAALAAIAIFFAGAYSNAYFMGRAFTPQLGLQNVAELATARWSLLSRQLPALSRASWTSAPIPVQ